MRLHHARHIRLLTTLMAMGMAIGGRVSAADFPLKDGDTWVFEGDSITAQRLYSEYFEAFCFARYRNISLCKGTQYETADADQKMQAFAKETVASDPKIRETARPAKLHFEIQPVQ